MKYVENEIKYNVERCLENFRETETLVSLEYIDDELRELMNVNLMDKHWMEVLADVLAQMEVEGTISSYEIINADGYSKVYCIN